MVNQPRSEPCNRDVIFTHVALSEPGTKHTYYSAPVALRTRVAQHTSGRVSLSTSRDDSERRSGRLRRARHKLGRVPLVPQRSRACLLARARTSAPTAFLVPMSAPESSSRRIASRCALAAAAYSGVQPACKQGEDAPAGRW